MRNAGIRLLGTPQGKTRDICVGWKVIRSIKIDFSEIRSQGVNVTDLKHGLSLKQLIHAYI
jgi:hypothetical protein